ncbi:GTPase IMAP family member 9-like [Esox lucius]|uniref:GTPase IMAP family member 9-like n=1 Tax=Esox lucius TaxID=8010 RepID=UPI0014769B0E|nr:GTPase IMAP family member 9-like [Esox lucius]
MQVISKPVQETSTPLQVVLLGKTGAGKSASGNTILGQRAFESKKSSKSVTTDIQTVSAKYVGNDLVVYDTPGFGDPDRSTEEIQEKFQNVLNRTSSGPRVFLLVLKIDRFTEEEKNVISKAEELLGQCLLKQTWILFTRGDELEGRTIEEFIDESEDLTEVVKKYSGRYHVFNNMSSDPYQVNSLLEKKFTGFNSTICPIRNLPERRIILLGKTGVGKSASGNTILDRKCFHSELSTSSITRTTELQKGVIDGRMVSVVDTPGLFDTQLSVEEIAKEIEKSLDLFSTGLHAFLIVMSIKDRFTEKEQQAVENLESLFGSGMSEYAIILFTHGDQLKGHDMKKLINANQNLSRVVEKCGGRYHFFNNNDRGNRAQVRELMEKINRMVEENGRTCYTSDMFIDVAKEKAAVEERKKREEEERVQRRRKITEKDKGERINREKEKMQKESGSIQEEKELNQREEEEINQKEKVKPQTEQEEKIQRDRERLQIVKERIQKEKEGIQREKEIMKEKE